MTNKRKHQLERKVRLEFKPFNDAVNNYTYIMLLYRIADLMDYKVSYLYKVGMIDIIEADFMRKCSMNYLFYYKNYIKHNAV